jgi:hypothetical protein
MQGSIDLKLFCKASGAIYTVKPPDQSGLRMTIPSGNTIQHPVHPVNKIYIKYTTFPIQYFGPLGPTMARMTGQIFLPPVRFGFGYPEPFTAAIVPLTDQIGANQRRGDFQHIP